MTRPPDPAWLRRLRAEDAAVISVYLPVPLDMAEHRALATRARELIKSAGDGADPADLDRIAQEVGLHGHDWLGHTAAMFASSAIGLFEAAPLPGQVAERAVLAPRPHTLPLLAALQRNPPYHAVVIDTRHAWILAVDGDRIETLARRDAAGVRSPGFSGWYGLQAYRIQQRVMRLAKLHFRDTVAELERAAGGSRRPVVIGGHEDEVRRFITDLPHGLRQQVAGSFGADLRTLTPARVRDLATPVIEEWARSQERRLVSDLLSQASSALVTTGLAGCLVAARAGAIGHLVLSDGQLVPGFTCEGCGALAISPSACDCSGPGRIRPIPDLLDELACRVLDGGGQVTAVRDAPFSAAAWLRFPVAGQAQVPAVTR